MARILIGNIKGPQGEQGPQGVQGPVGPQGPQGPLPPLVNNALATEAGVAALDAAMGKTLQDQITNNKNDIAQLNSNLTGFSVSLKSSGANCDDLLNGIWLVRDATNGPGTGWWMIISGGDVNTRKQIAFDLDNGSTSQTRNFSAGSAVDWSDLK